MELSKEVTTMITAAILLVITIVCGILLLAGGAGVILVFGDFIVFGLILYWILRAIFRDR